MRVRGAAEHQGSGEVPGHPREAGLRADQGEAHPCDAAHRQVGLPQEAARRVRRGRLLINRLAHLFELVGVVGLHGAQARLDGLVLFNRFYQPDIDIEKLETVPKKVPEQVVEAEPD